MLGASDAVFDHVEGAAVGLVDAVGDGALADDRIGWLCGFHCCGIVFAGACGRTCGGKYEQLYPRVIGFSALSVEGVIGSCRPWSEV